MDKKEKKRIKKDCTDLLNVSMCLAEFTKADGTNRVMKCTLQKSIVPPSNDKDGFSRQKFRNRPENEDVMIVWDVEAKEGAGDWRSFRIDRIKSFKALLDD